MSIIFDGFMTMVHSGQQDHYHFPSIDEESHRFSRLIGAIIAVCVAMLPFFINLVWRVYAENGSDSAPGVSNAILESGFTDLALAGVVIVVSTFTNTYFSVKLLGWQSVSGFTFASLLFVTISSIFSFVAYIQSAHEHIASSVKFKAFLATLFVVFSCIIWSFIALFCFLDDEFRGAREELRKLPPA